MSGSFQRRVRDLIEDRFGRRTTYAYSHRAKGSPAPTLAENTLKQWLRPERPCTPFTDRLVAFAEEMGVTLDYLILGREPKRPGVSRGDSALAEDLRAHLVAALGTSPRERRFFEGAVPSGKDLLRDVVSVVGDAIERVYRERTERTRAELTRLLLERLDQARDPAERNQIRAQIIAGTLRPPSGAPLLDEGTPLSIAKRPAAPTQAGIYGKAVIGKVAYRREAAARRAVAERLSPAEITYLKAREQSLTAGESSRRREVKARRRASRSAR